MKMTRKEFRKHVADINRKMKEERLALLARLPAGPRYQVEASSTTRAGKLALKCWVMDTETGRKVKGSTRGGSLDDMNAAEAQARKLNAAVSGLFTVKGQRQ